MATADPIDDYRPRGWRFHSRDFSSRLVLHSLWRAASAKPAVATRHVFALTIGLSYLVGGGLGLSMLLLARGAPHGTGALTGLSIFGLLCGGGMIIEGRVLSMRAYHLVIALGTVVVGAAIQVAGGGARSVGLASLYVFVVIGCFFLFAWTSAVLHLIFVEACSMVAFASVGVAESDVIVQQGCLVAVGLIVGWLTRAAASAERDALTGLANRRGFDRTLDEAITAAKRTGAALSIVLLDFDSFRTINDQGGHADGDRVLRWAAAAWKQLVGPGQLLARPGGDEFALILPGFSAAEAAAVADRFRAAIVAESTCSAGVAELEGQDSRSKLVGRADVALYEAKSRSGDQTRQYRSKAENGKDAAMAVAIRAGLAAGHFEAYYQPIIDLRIGLVTGDEALLRWNCPVRGLVTPDEFIPAAERSGVIQELGQWILREACSSTARYIAESGLPRRVSVNASGHELKTAGYAGRVAAILAETGLSPAALIIEVTESTFDADHPCVISVLHELRGLGVGIAIDDFGTGYSSLNRLDRLPANVLKIDRSFVSSIPAGAGADLPILKAIVALADALQLRIIAEGVETAHQAQVLAELGCSHAQGYYFGRPHPIQQPAWSELLAVVD